jgi:hypothetical protein
MMNDYWKTTVDLMECSKRTINAADILHTALAEGTSRDVESTCDVLARIAYDYANYTNRYERFSLVEMASMPPGEPSQQQLTSGLLVNILLDLEVANILLITSQVTGETTGPAVVESLDMAVYRLETLVDQVALPLTWTAEAPATLVHFTFEETPIVPLVHPTMNLAIAKANFRQQVDEILATLVAQTKNVLQAGWESIQKLDQKQIITAIGQIGEKSIGLPRPGKLVKQGLNLIIQALQKLIRLLGPESIELLQEEGSQLIAQLKNKTTLLDEFLIHAYRIDETKSYVINLLRETKTDIIHLYDGSRELVELHSRLAEQMTLINRIISTLNISKGMAEFVLPKATTMIIFGVFYLVAMDYAVLTGMDFADSALLFNLVPGVISISEAILA